MSELDTIEAPVEETSAAPVDTRTLDESIAELGPIEDFKGKTLSMRLDDHEDVNEYKDYLVEEATPVAYILREKGKSKSNLYLVASILAFKAPAPKPPTPLKAKRVAPLEENKAKRHLLDFHAYKLSDINPLTAKDALAFHESIDHAELDLGHYHGLSKAEEAAAAGDEDFETETVEVDGVEEEV
jgi:hypothetical protein